MPDTEKDGTIQIYRNYKVSINPVLQVDRYPLPNPDELMASLAGGKQFTKLDLTSAYQQMLLNDDSAKLATINTHKGVYECTQLPLVQWQPWLFSAGHGHHLQGIPIVLCHFDDILVTGTSEADHLNHLEEVLRRLQAREIHMRRDKCHFFQPSVTYLAHHIDAKGIHTSAEKVKLSTMLQFHNI